MTLTPGRPGGRRAGGAGWSPAPLRRAPLRRAPLRGLPLLAAVLGSLLIGALGPAFGLGPSTARAASPDLTLVTDASYTVRPSARLVHVAVRIVARYQKAETRTHRFYVDHAFLAVPPGTSGFRIGGAKGATVQVTKRATQYAMLRIGLGGRLYGGSTRTLNLSFDMRDAGHAAQGQVRVRGSLASFPAWAFASEGTAGSTVSVTFPAGYQVSLQQGVFAHTRKTAAGGTRLWTNALSTPLTWFAYVVGEREATFADTALDVTAGGVTIPLRLRAWTDDPAWARRIASLYRKALPVLVKDIGLPWPHGDVTTVQEAASRATGGYAGMYDPTGIRIEVASWADTTVAIHEAAHGWFNGALLADRWAAEGFASLYAERATRALKHKATSPRLTAAVKAARIPLDAWPPPAGASDAAVDAYGYAASLALARAIAERAGDQALRDVWADAAARMGAYQPPVPADGDGVEAPGTPSAPDPEAVTSPPGWRGLLDLLETRTGKDFGDLWRAWVVSPEEARLLDDRAAARASYARTLGLARGWVLPRAIRDAMRDWRFQAAQQLMADVRTVLAQRLAVEDQAARLGLRLPDTMRQLFEAGSLVEASREAEAQLNAMLLLDGAEAQRPTAPDLLTEIGMLGSRPDADLAAARASFERGDLDPSVASTRLAYATWSDAWQEGRRRALLGAAVLAALLVLVLAVVRAIRRTRRPGGHAPSPFPPGPTPPAARSRTPPA